MVAAPAVASECIVCRRHGIIRKGMELPFETGMHSVAGLLMLYRASLGTTKQKNSDARSTREHPGEDEDEVEGDEDDVGEERMICMAAAIIR